MTALNLRLISLLGRVRHFSAHTPPRSPSQAGAAAAACAGPPKINENVPGLSSKCVLPRSQPLGPGASPSGEYKVPEYYCYDKNSYAEAEIEMANFRCPQPDAHRKN